MMNMHYVGTPEFPPFNPVGLLGEDLRFRVQHVDDSGSWKFADTYVYDLEAATHEWRTKGEEGRRVVKVSWADFQVVHSIVRGPR